MVGTMAKTLEKLGVASVLAGAVAAASLVAPATAATFKHMEACYGISRSGQNSCANAWGNHSCAGQSKIDFSGAEFRVVKEGTCVALKGKLKHFEGINTAMKANT